ncbi:MAG TPA: chaperone modulator CbpM [Saprospiraceae bacterium]|nr:chaperone modulator CbpM [Saprospiraceae bacterium]
MEKNLIAVTTLCSHYEIELSFVHALEHNGLIQVEIVREEPCLPEDQIRDFEKMIRLHHELNLNIEAIDVIFNLLQKEEKLRAELDALKNRLKRYELQ